MFFFSSRRRHTRYWRDWSSDVCSSDLYYCAPISGQGSGRGIPQRRVLLPYPLPCFLCFSIFLSVPLLPSLLLNARRQIRSAALALSGHPVAVAPTPAHSLWADHRMETPRESVPAHRNCPSP